MMRMAAYATPTLPYAIEHFERLIFGWKQLPARLPDRNAYLSRYTKIGIEEAMKYRPGPQVSDAYVLSQCK